MLGKILLESQLTVRLEILQQIQKSRVMSL